MHSFDNLIQRSTSFTLIALNDAHQQLSETFEYNASTSMVKNLQMIRLTKAIFAVGMFSMFDGELQKKLSCENGFNQASIILKQKGENNLNQRFLDFKDAINVLKHGDGPSYKRLLKKIEPLPFRMKRHGVHFFEEGDVSEVSTLIEVNDKFIDDCVELISSVYQVIRKH